MGYTLICDDCFREFSEWDDSGFEDEIVCPVCNAKRIVEYLKSPCKICGKPMGKDKHPFFNIDNDSAHGECVSKLSDKEFEEGEWSDEYC